jgi:uncharacterized repeat protein (TIGR03943 family)
MIRLSERFQQLNHIIILGGWVAAFSYLLFTGRYVDFIRPEFGLLLLTAIFIAVGFITAGLITSPPAESAAGSPLQPLVFILPLLFLIFLPRADLGSDAFKKRFTGPTPMAATSFQKKDAVPNDPSSSEQTILDLFKFPESYNGRQVTFTGMIMRHPELKSYFGWETAIYRFLVTCCVADAMPLAVSVPPDLIKTLKTEQWVKVTGRFELREKDGKPVPVVETGTATPIAPPDFPYLF